MLHAGLCICMSLALSLVYISGYPLLALLLLPAVSLLLWQLRRERMAGASILWQQGSWVVVRHGHRVPVEIRPRSNALPWVIYLAWRDVPNGRSRHIWLFHDSAAPAQLRCLRVRLNLER